MSHPKGVPAIVVEHFGERIGNVMIAKALIDSVAFNGILEAPESLGVGINAIRIATRTQKSKDEKRDKLIVQRIELERVVKAKPPTDEVTPDNMITFTTTSVLEQLTDTLSEYRLASLTADLEVESTEMYAYSIQKDYNTTWSIVADEIYHAVVKFVTPRQHAAWTYVGI